MPLNRPYIRQSVRQVVEARALKNEDGRFLDANTGKLIEGKYDLGHKPGHEHWRMSEMAEKEGLSQEEFNDQMNNPDYYHIEDPSENRSHKHEMKGDGQSSDTGQKQNADDSHAQAEAEASQEQASEAAQSM